MSFENLLKPGKLGALELKNRIVMSSHSTELSGESGEVTDKQVAYLARRAKGGAGLVISEICSSATTIDPLRILAHTLRADDARFIPELARLAEAIHENGAKASAQMTAGGGAQAVGGPWIIGAQVQAVSPSGVPALGKHEHAAHPRVLTIEEIKGIIELFGLSSSNVKKAGFDVIEIHAVGGYLITEFLSPYFNKRTDEYGGSFDNRCRFLLEIIDSIRKAVGAEIPITVKWSMEDFLPGGWDFQQSKDLAKKLEIAGVDGIAISCGVHSGKLPAVPPYIYPMGTFLHYAKALKDIVSIPIMATGRLDDPQIAEDALKEGKADFIVLARGMIADPDWSQKIAGGQIKEIRPCLACSECRQNVVIKRIPIRCSVNAVAGREDELDSITPAAIKKKVLIAGGGPAGMEAARVAALRGHSVVLCEKYGQLGGIMLIGGVHNERIAAFVDWLSDQIRKLPVEVRLRTEVTDVLVEEIKSDVVILATGGSFVTLDVPGIDGDNVFSASDLLKVIRGIPINKGFLLRAASPFAKGIITAEMVNRLLGARFPVKKNVAVIGGQFPGCSLALLLAHKGKKVTVIEESDQYGQDMEAHTMVGFNNEVQKGNIQVLTSAKVAEVTKKGVAIMNKERNNSFVEAGTVIVALDLIPSSDSNLLAQKLGGKVKEVYTIGDAKSFQRIMNAVSEGYVTAYNL
ncbi:FAD-dependent oxidoreductase [Chloroflexota bacterium]